MAFRASKTKGAVKQTLSAWSRFFFLTVFSMAIDWIVNEVSVVIPNNNLITRIT